jgi:hypothetical protein
MPLPIGKWIGENSATLAFLLRSFDGSHLGTAGAADAAWIEASWNPHSGHSTVPEFRGKVATDHRTMFSLLHQGAIESGVSQAVMVIRQSPTTAETMLMNPGIESMSIAILRPPSWMMATSSALRAKKLVILNAPGSAVLPLLARTLAESERPDRGGLHDDVKSQCARDSAIIEIPPQGKDLAAVNASEVGSGERD